MAIANPYHRIWRPMSGYSWLNRMWEEDSSVPTLDYLHDFDFADQQEMNSLLTTARLIIRDLYELFNYVEPNNINLQTYSHRLYELLLRAATEFEANCKAILDANEYVKTGGGNLNITDYFKIEAATKLSDYVVSFDRWPNHDFKPFYAWSSGIFAPLPWYQGYNQVKHNRYANFHKANFDNVMNAVAGLLCILHAQIGERMDPVCFEGIAVQQNTQDEVVNGTFTIKAPTFTDAEKYGFIWDDSKGVKVAVKDFIF
ncbi:hypothetical protein [Bacteroides caecimuris]|uniref:hypothetical protein n=1 Tax=Bacteroides caecimuris TaxID=1796613 RepID=UPI002430E73D|nr:hypothetical protein [Bacteroides caecimuris]